jgi:hypothetical protein
VLLEFSDACAVLASPVAVVLLVVLVLSLDIQISTTLACRDGRLVAVAPESFETASFSAPRLHSSLDSCTGVSCSNRVSDAVPAFVEAAAA